MAIINIPVNPYKTMVDVLKNSVNYQKQRPRSIVHKSFENKHLNMQINLTFDEKWCMIIV